MANKPALWSLPAHVKTASEMAIACQCVKSTHVRGGKMLIPSGLNSDGEILWDIEKRATGHAKHIYGNSVSSIAYKISRKTFQCVVPNGGDKIVPLCKVTDLIGIKEEEADDLIANPLKHNAPYDTKKITRHQIIADATDKWPFSYYGRPEERRGAKTYQAFYYEAPPGLEWDMEIVCGGYGLQPTMFIDLYEKNQSLTGYGDMHGDFKHGLYEITFGEPEITYLK